MPLAKLPEQTTELVKHLEAFVIHKSNASNDEDKKLVTDSIDKITRMYTSLTALVAFCSSSFVNVHIVTAGDSMHFEDGSEYYFRFGGDRNLPGNLKDEINKTLEKVRLSCEKIIPNVVPKKELGTDVEVHSVDEWNKLGK